LPAAACDAIHNESILTVIYTVGHSNHPIERLIALLRRHQITAIADVRSAPYSRHNPQFNREALRNALAQSSIGYAFLGDELGARSKDRSCYEAGRLSYARLAATELFRQGLKRLKTGMIEHRIAIMCAERDPLECHRTILVSRHLAADNIQVEHILGSGELEPHPQALARLRRQLGIPEHDMLRDDEELSNEAYELQGQRIAYVDAGPKIQALREQQP
jgi:uncharacterized protein (DUF488 family)